MEIQLLVNCSFIMVGAIIMLISIFCTKQLMEVLNFVPERQRRHVRMSLILHRLLMVFFLCGYLVVLVSFVFNYSFISDTFISLIFFFGAVFVYMGVRVQSRLLSEVQNTLQGILPICCKCKKIRSSDSEPTDSKSCKRIEEFLTDKTKVNFSHGFCPECFEVEMRQLKQEQKP